MAQRYRVTSLIWSSSSLTPRVDSLTSHRCKRTGTRSIFAMPVSSSVLSTSVNLDLTLLSVPRHV